MRVRVCFLSAAMFLLAAFSLCAQQKTTVTGTFYFRDGTTPFNGTVRIVNGRFKTADDYQIVPRTQSFTISSGTFSIDLEPTDSSTPLGSSYTVSFESTAGFSQLPRTWWVPISSNSIDESVVLLKPGTGRLLTTALQPYGSSGSGEMIYPRAGIPKSLGNAWDTSSYSIGTTAGTLAAGDDSRFATPTNATATKAANKIPISDNSGLLDSWITAGLIPACAGAPGNTTGVYQSLCVVPSTGALYACKNASNCTVAADWASAGSSSGTAALEFTFNTTAGTCTVTVGTGSCTASATTGSGSVPGIAVTHNFGKTTVWPEVVDSNRIAAGSGTPAAAASVLGWQTDSGGNTTIITLSGALAGAGSISAGGAGPRGLQGDTGSPGTGNVNATNVIADGVLVLGDGGSRNIKGSTLSGVIKLTSGVPSAVTGSASDFVRVDGSSAAGSATTLTAYTFNTKSANNCSIVTDNVRLSGIILPVAVTFSKFVLYVSTLDSNSAHLYDFGIYSTSGSLLANIGAQAFTSSGTKDLSTTQGSVTLQPGKYYMAWTGNANTAQISCATAGTTFLDASYGSATSGGALPSTTTYPADSWNGYGQLPSFGVH